MRNLWAAMFVDSTGSIFQNWMLEIKFHVDHHTTHSITYVLLMYWLSRASERKCKFLGRTQKTLQASHKPSSHPLVVHVPSATLDMSLFRHWLVP